VASPLEIRPLQMFYGMVGFAKALVVASRCQSLATLRGSHGLKDVSAAGCRIAEQQVKIESAGTFQEFNDVVAGATRFCYHDEALRPSSVRTPAASSNDITGFKLSLSEVLNRIPNLEELFQRTFGEIANTAPMFVDNIIPGRCTVQVSEPQYFSSRDAVKTLVAKWRVRHPFLTQWRLINATHEWGRSTFYFHNVANPGLEELEEPALIQHGDTFQAPSPSIDQANHFPFLASLPPMGGGYTGGHPYPISRVQGRYLSEFALQYLGMFILSSLVRYRPQTWMHAISRSVTAEGPADDQALSLIDRFLEISGESVPQMVLTMLNPQEDLYSAG
jgi:hypothetical protein